MQFLFFPKLGRLGKFYKSHTIHVRYVYLHVFFFMVNVGRIDKYTRTIYEWYIPFVNGMGMKLHQGESRWQLPNVLISIFQACKKTYTPEN